jgi:hypothetical protein
LVWSSASKLDVDFLKPFREEDELHLVPDKVLCSTPKKEMESFHYKYTSHLTGLKKGKRTHPPTIVS